MLFDVPIRDQEHLDRHEAFAYCFTRIKDRWEDAVYVIDGDDRQRVSIRGMPHSPTCMQVFLSSDSRLTGRLLHKPVPVLTIIYKNGHICFRPRNGAEDIARWMATLPIWSHKVQSERLIAVGA